MSGIRSPSSEIKGDSFGGAGSSCNCSASKAARRLKVPKVRLQRQQQFPMAPDPLFGTGVGTGLGSGVGTGVATPAKMATDQIGRQAGGQAGRQAQAGRAIP